MSYFTASQIGKALAKARVSAGLSQAEIARRIEKRRAHRAELGKGCTSPDSDEIMDWCTACGVSPISMFMEMIHPDLYKVPDDSKADDELNTELRRLVVSLPPLTKKAASLHTEGQSRQQPACCHIGDSCKPPLPPE